MSNEDLVIVCVVLLPAWPLCTPTRTMCPLPHCLCPIASACNWDLRQNRMEADTITNKPLYGWRLNTNHSRIALEWLHWQ